MTRKRKNSKLFTVGTCESVNMETGEVVPVEGGGLKMLPGPDGSCEWCHVFHEPDQPHNKDSLPYQIKFKTIHGRYPTWTDAMAHCTPEIKSVWREGLRESMREVNMEIPDDLQGDE